METQAALASAPDAIATALEAQRAMLTESWPADNGPLRVRMACMRVTLSRATVII
jgi:hypothetical protein